MFKFWWFLTVSNRIANSNSKEDGRTGSNISTFRTLPQREEEKTACQHCACLNLNGTRWRSDADDRKQLQLSPVPTRTGE